MSDPAQFVPPFGTLLRGLGLDTLESDADFLQVDRKFLTFLVQEFARLLPFDPAFYAASYPDIAAALTHGQLASAHEHFVMNGFQEGRQPYRLPFDPAFYLARNPDLQPIHAGQGAAGLRAHYLNSGAKEGRAAHPATEPDALRWAWAMHASQVDQLASRTIEGALVQAFQQPLAEAPPIGFRGGLVLGDSAADRLLRHRRGHRAVDSFPPDTGPIGALSGAYVYGGPAYHHFGHVMAEMVHRILPARAVFDCRRLLFVGATGAPVLGGFETLAPAMQAPLLFLGVEPADVTVVRDNRVIERLHVAQQGSELQCGPLPPYLRLLADYTPARLDALHDGSTSPAKLYVSRSQLREGGLLLGERYLEQLLEAEGWSVLHPQDHTLVAQMQAYHRAESIIFLSGSACHGTELFGARGLGHVALLPRGHTPNHFFESLLRPRSRRFSTLPDATLIGSAVADRATGAVAEQLGVSILNLPAITQALRAFGLADVQQINAACYRAAALADLHAYIEFHRHRDATQPTGQCLVPEPQAAALVARCTALLA
jgi:hypothetical protein